MQTFFTLVGFGPTGWGWQLLLAAWMTLSVSAAAFVLGLVCGTLGAWAKLSRSPAARRAGDFYTTVLRGIPDLLVVYLFYFGGSEVLTAAGRLLGQSGFFGFNSFMAGALAIGIISGAYQTEAIRGAYHAIPRGEIEAARAVGMPGFLMLRRIIAPRVLRFALPAMGNVWQSALKDSALISVTGLAEILREIHIGAGSTSRPFDFYVTGFILYLMLTTISGAAFRGAENWTMRSERRV